MQGPKTTISFIIITKLFAGILGQPRPVSLWYLITITALFIMCTLSLITIGIKKFEAYQKERKLAKSVNIMINNVPPLAPEVVTIPLQIATK